MKKYVTCGWCEKHIVEDEDDDEIYFEYEEGSSNLIFCSKECLNNYIEDRCSKYNNRELMDYFGKEYDNEVDFMELSKEKEIDKRE